MSQIQTKFITPNAIDDTLIRLRNNNFLRGRNAANSADISLFKVNASDNIEFGSVPQVTSDPSVANDLVRKSYVDAAIQGLKWKEPVLAISTSNITLSGPQTIDGVSLVAGDRVLVAGQTTQTNNGIYVVAAGSWTRAVDADASSEFESMAVFVNEGTTYAASAWVCTTLAPITLGSSNLTYVQFTGTAALTVNLGLTKTGNNIDVTVGDNSLTATTNSLVVKLNTSGAIVVTGTGLKVNLEASNPSLQIASNELGVKFDSAGALQKGSGGVSVKVDAATIKINGSNQLQGLTWAKENITLSGTDITNQYVDLAHAAVSNSMHLSVVGVTQYEGSDYTLSIPGSVTRVTFAGDLATGGAAALVAGDVVRVQYMYL